MTRLELLANQLESEALPHELQATQQVFTDNLGFWELCLEAKRLLLEEKELKLDKAEKRLQIKKLKKDMDDDKDNGTGNI